MIYCTNYLFTVCVRCSMYLQTAAVCTIVHALSAPLGLDAVVLFTGLFATVSRNVPTKLSNQM